MSDAERRFFSVRRPLGFILFARNCENPEQTRALVADLRGAVGRADAPVLIDQEGGRVARLGPPHWRKAPAAARFGKLYLADAEVAVEMARRNARLIAAELIDLGIDVDCTPVLDLAVAGADRVIGDRAFGGDPQMVASLGRAVCEGLLAGGVMPVVKHVPGHGRATADSHKALPEVDANLEVLRATDFAPFAALADAPWAMTAHLRYLALDAESAATLSATVIGETIRGEIGFDGVLISDDLSMAALSGSLAFRASAALAAGCDLVLHCNGEMAEMVEIADAIGAVAPSAARRLARADERRAEAVASAGICAFDAAAARAELDSVLADGAVSR